MNLDFDNSLISKYTSNSQIARVLTEGWVKKNCYCPSCGNDHLNSFENNSPVADFLCQSCKSEYELKSKKDKFTSKIVDGAYESMIRRINSKNNPHFFFLNYSIKALEVKNFVVIPKHYFVDSIIEKRKALGINARRANWVGCNILLNNIPDTGKILIIKDGVVKDRKKVIDIWAKTAFLEKQEKDNRGWTIEMLKLLERVQNLDFTLDQVYAYETDLKARFPNNNFIRDKMRQQLQILRDKGLIEFKGRGLYRKI